MIAGEKCFIGAGAVVRGDYSSIVIGNGSNVQENCVLHAQPGTTATVEKNVDIGHGSIIHGPCTILTPNMKIPPNKLALGNPARVDKDVTEQQQTFTRVAVGLYQDLCERYQNTFKRTEK